MRESFKERKEYKGRERERDPTQEIKEIETYGKTELRESVKKRQNEPDRNKKRVTLIEKDSPRDRKVWRKSIREKRKYVGDRKREREAERKYMD